MTRRREDGPGAQSEWLRIPEALRPWMIDPHSLTRRMQATCDGRFHVRLLTQHMGPALHVEARRLRLRGRERVLVREVLLMCGETPWVFARTVVPTRTLRGPLRRLAGLGTRPLGEILFAERSTRRAEVELFRLERGSDLARATAGALGRLPQPSWARRSLFNLRHRPLLVTEVFLPELFHG